MTCNPSHITFLAMLTFGPKGLLNFPVTNRTHIVGYSNLAFYLSGHFYWLFATMIHRDDDYDGEYEVTIFNVFAGIATCLSVGDVSKWYKVHREGISEANKGDVSNYMFKIVGRWHKRR